MKPLLRAKPRTKVRVWRNALTMAQEAFRNHNMHMKIIKESIGELTKICMDCPTKDQPDLCPHCDVFYEIDKAIAIDGFGI